MAVQKSRCYVVHDSAIHGRGVFAARRIAKDEKVIEYRGQRTTWDVANDRPSPDPDNPYHTFVFGLEDGSVIDASVRGNAARWINHSCRPNCEAVEDDEGRVFIAARRSILPGEELTYDYALVLEGRVGKRQRDSYRCRCGAPRCRGTMLATG